VRIAGAYHAAFALLFQRQRSAMMFTCKASHSDDGQTYWLMVHTYPSIFLNTTALYHPNACRSQPNIPHPSLKLPSPQDKIRRHAG